MFQNITLLSEERFVTTSNIPLYNCVQHAEIVRYTFVSTLTLIPKSKHIFTQLLFIDHVCIPNIIAANTIQQYVYIIMSNNVKLLSTRWRRPNIVFRGRQRFTVTECTYNIVRQHFM